MSIVLWNTYVKNTQRDQLFNVAIYVYTRCFKGTIIELITIVHICCFFWLYTSKRYATKIVSNVFVCNMTA